MRALAILVLLLLPIPASAGESAGEFERLGRLLDRAVADAAAELEQLLNRIPRFGVPHLNERGDVVIPRLPPQDEGTRPAPSRDQSTT